MLRIGVVTDTGSTREVGVLEGTVLEMSLLSCRTKTDTCSLGCVVTRVDRRVDQGRRVGGQSTSIEGIFGGETQTGGWQREEGAGGKAGPGSWVGGVEGQHD